MTEGGGIREDALCGVQAAAGRLELVRKKGTQAEEGSGAEALDLNVCAQ